VSYGLTGSFILKAKLRQLLPGFLPTPFCIAVAGKFYAAQNAMQGMQYKRCESH